MPLDFLEALILLATTFLHSLFTFINHIHFELTLCGGNCKAQRGRLDSVTQPVYGKPRM